MCGAREAGALGAESWHRVALLKGFLFLASQLPPCQNPPPPCGPERPSPSPTGFGLWFPVLAATSSSWEM